MKKNSRLLSLLLSFALVFTMSMTAFANTESGSETAAGKKMTDEEILDVIDDASDEDINLDIQREDDSFVTETADGEIRIPDDGEDNVQLETNGYDIEMSLPKQFASVEGEFNEGTVLYNDEDMDAACAVQTIETEVDDQCGVRALITIEDADAPHKYSFDFDVPEGCQIIQGEQYANSAEAEKGYLFVVDMNNIITNEKTGETYPESILAIEPAWAKDANGNDIPTCYELDGTTVTQVVEFDEGTAFPVVADPQYGGYYYDKVNVKYSLGYGTPKRCSHNMTLSKGEEGHISCNVLTSVSGSIKGKTKGIHTIGVGSTFSVTVGYSITFKGPATKYMAIRAWQKIENGTRRKIRLSTGDVVDTNKYTVRKNLEREVYLRAL